MFKIRFILIVAAVIWIFGYVVFYQQDDSFKKIISKLKRLEMTYSKNEENINELIKEAMLIKKQIKSEPSLDDIYRFQQAEDLRRKIFSDVQDISFYYNAHIYSYSLSNQANVDSFKQNFNDRINAILSNILRHSEVDYFSEFRKNQLTKLSEMVQSRLNQLQNPPDCSKATKLVCNLEKGCGFGCQMHHLSYCFTAAYYANRTLVIISHNWKYDPKGLNQYFLPVSKCNVDNEETYGWDETLLKSSKNLMLPIIDLISNSTKFLPQSVPQNLFKSLRFLHSSPFVWWTGQLLTYLLRFNPRVVDLVQASKRKINFAKPCVGIHVRRTDKIGTEAAEHALAEYLSKADEYFLLQEKILNKINIPRIIYLATDESDLFNETNRWSSKYTFVYERSNAELAYMMSRYTPVSVEGIIKDIYFLSQCDFLVCTFSSQVCRMAYELMQARYAEDASWRFRSLDDVYYYGGQSPHDVRAIYDHEADEKKGEIEIRVGDRIGLAGNHWNGFSKGLNRRTNKEGLFPSYKVEDVYQYF